MVVNMDDEKERTLYCGNLDENVTEELLYELFLQMGPLDRIHIPKDKVTQKQKQFGFITFKYEVSVPYAIEMLNGIRMFGKNLRIKPRGSDVAPNRGSNGPGMAPHGQMMPPQPGLPKSSTWPNMAQAQNANQGYSNNSPTNSGNNTPEYRHDYDDRQSDRDNRHNRRDSRRSSRDTDRDYRNGPDRNSRNSRRESDDRNGPYEQSRTNRNHKRQGSDTMYIQSTDRASRFDQPPQESLVRSDIDQQRERVLAQQNAMLAMHQVQQQQMMSRGGYNTAQQQPWQQRQFGQQQPPLQPWQQQSYRH
ncbi:unnamed protein product [Owenia fusiformis]|uniref:Uncharacterized protein n=1 Tax=Owenia fusiformis TaxID=6347 RepID=A0A8J1TWM1_OWEFU|nr:unnamed protein product [Owenia fusiformis]